MDRIRNKYNPEASELKAQKCLDGITKTEFQGWLEHPCTKSLKYTLESELDQLVLNLVKGGYSTATIEGTAILQAKAVGTSEAVELIMSYIDEMLENSQRENAYEEAIYNP